METSSSSTSSSKLVISSPSRSHESTKHDKMNIPAPSNGELVDPWAKNGKKILVKNHPKFDFEYGSGYEINPVKKRRPIKFLDPKQSFGKDDGKGAQTLLFSYVEEVLNRMPPQQPEIIDDHVTDDFKESEFLQKITHPQFQDIPLVSQVAHQLALKPIHTREKTDRIRGVCHALKRNDGLLVRARMNSEGIDDKFAKIIAASLERNIYLQHLMLHDNFITDDGVKALCSGARWHPSLHTLWLGANFITDIGVKQIALLLKRNPNIKVLNISNQWPEKVTWTGVEQTLHPHITYIGAEYLAKELLRGCGLTSLCLSDQRVRDHGASFIFQTLKRCHLRSLTLKGNELTDTCCIALRDALSSNPRLEKLDISKNTIGDRGAELIAQSLQVNDVIQALNISYNVIDTKGFDAFVEALETNRSLLTLFTLYNKVYDTRAELIVSLRKGTHDAFLLHPDKSLWDVTSYDSNNNDTLDKNRTLNLLANQAAFWSDDPNDYSPAKDTPSRENRSSSSSRLFSPEILMSPPFSPSSSSASRGRSPSRSAHRSSRGGTPLPTLPSPFGENSEEIIVSADVDIGFHGKRTPSRPLSQNNPDVSGSDQYQAYRLNSRQDFRLKTPNNSNKSSSKQNSSQGQRGVNTDEDGERPDDHRDQFGGLSNSFTDMFSSSLPSQPLSMSDSLTQLPPLDLSSQDHHRPDSRLAIIPSRSGSRSGSAASARSSSRGGSKPRYSADIGKTLGVPNLGNLGVMPVRTATNRHVDSAQHLLYLRVATPDDPPEARPYSLIDIAKDQREERARVLAERQKEEYKEMKRLKFAEFVKRRRSVAADRAPPDSFWPQWLYMTKVMYPKGIDNARGAKSVRGHHIQYSEEDKQNIALYNEMEAQLESLRGDGAKGAQGSGSSSSAADAKPGGEASPEKTKASKQPITNKKESKLMKFSSTPGGILAARRQDYTLRKEKDRILKEKQLEKIKKLREAEISVIESNHSKVELRSIMGLRKDQSFGDAIDKRGLTSKSGVDEIVALEKNSGKSIWGKAKNIY